MAAHNVALVKFQFILSEALILLIDNKFILFNVHFTSLWIFQSTTDGFSNTKQKHSTMCNDQKANQTSFNFERKKLELSFVAAIHSLLVVDGNQHQET